MKNLFVSMALSLCAFLAPPSLLAQLGNLPGQLFLTGTVGQATISDTDFEEDVNDFLKNDSDTAFGVGVGYMFHENIGVEAGYKDFGEYGFDTPGGNAKSSGFNLGLIAETPLQNQFDVYGKVGFLMWESDISLSGFSNESGDGTDLYFGFGAKYNISKEIAVGLEWVRHNYSDEDVIITSESTGNLAGFELDDNDITVIGVTLFYRH